KERFSMMSRSRARAALGSAIERPPADLAVESDGLLIGVPSGESMRFVPVIGGAGIHMQRYRQRYRWQRRLDHHPGDDRQRLFHLFFRPSEHELVVHLQ